MLRHILKAQKFPLQVIRLQNLRNAPKVINQHRVSSAEESRSDLNEATYHKISEEKIISKNELGIDQAKSVIAAAANKRSESSLVITADQTDAIDARLDDKNFKSLIEKQAEIKLIIRAIDSPFLLFYLIDKHHQDLGSDNLITLLNKLVYFKFLPMRQQSQSESSAGVVNGETPKNDPAEMQPLLILPQEIKKIFTRLFLKLSPYFQPDQSLNALKRLVNLDLTLSDHCVQSVVQILKYQVNQLDVHELVYAKKLLDKLSDSSSQRIETDSFSRELLKNLEKAINLSLKLNRTNRSTSSQMRTNN